MQSAKRAEAATITIKSHEIPLVETAINQYTAHLRDDIEPILADSSEEPEEQWEKEALASLMVLETLGEILYRNEGSPRGVRLHIPRQVAEELERKICQFGNDVVANAADKQQARQNRDHLYDVADRIDAAF